MSSNAIKEAPMPDMTPSGDYPLTTKARGRSRSSTIASKNTKDNTAPLVGRDLVNPPSSAISEVPAMEFMFREQSREQQLHYYLESAIKAKHISADTASIAWRTWRHLLKATSNSLPVPDAGIGPDGQVLYTWKNDEHHFEIEVFPTGIGEVFYLNLNTDEMWDSEYKVGDPVTEEIKEKLGLLLLHD
jgi:hypothetical protein